jgi:hypothetical protein
MTHRLFANPDYLELLWGEVNVAVIREEGWTKAR